MRDTQVESNVKLQLVVRMNLIESRMLFNLFNVSVDCMCESLSTVYSGRLSTTGQVVDQIELHRSASGLITPPFNRYSALFG